MKNLLSNKNFSLSFSFLIAIAFFIFNYKLIMNGHFHEDAYILFIYIENFVQGNGITYYPGGPHIEGATDFLWLILLSILGKLGFDSGTSVILLNSLGVFIIIFLINYEIQQSKFNYKWLTVFFYPFIFLWILHPPIYAAVGGFSVYLYMSIVLLAYVSVQHDKYLIYTPYISLVLALFRPDGVIIGIGFTLIGLYLAYKRNTMRQYMFGLIFGLIVGSCYFIWRYYYFDNLLPLPLYVKGHGSLTAGLNSNLHWAQNHLYLILYPTFTLLLLSLSKKIRHYLFLSIPVVLLYLVLLTATQSQNVDYRFQAPIYIIAYYVFLLSCLNIFQEYAKNKTSTIISIAILFFFFIYYGDKGIKHANGTTGITKFNYINQVPLAINKVLPKDTSIVLTESGRIAYWNQLGNHKIFDLVGLNNEYPAKNTITINYLENIFPDMIMYHQAGRMNQKWLRNSNKKVVLLSNEDKLHLVNKRIYSSKQKQAMSKVGLASVIATEYLQKYFDKYDIFIVDYVENKSYSHIYAFKKTLNLKEKMNELLKHSFSRDTALSYYEMLKIRDNSTVSK